MFVTVLETRLESWTRRKTGKTILAGKLNEPADRFKTSKLHTPGQFVYILLLLETVDESLKVPIKCEDAVPGCPFKRQVSHIHPHILCLEWHPSI